MIGYLFSKLPWTTWLKVIFALILLAVTTWLLFEFVYPPLHEYLDGGMTVGEQSG